MTADSPRAGSRAFAPAHLLAAFPGAESHSRRSSTARRRRRACPGFPDCRRDRRFPPDGLDAAVGMPGKSRAIVFRTIVAEVVEQEEWIELAGIPEAEGATQLHARTFDCRFGLND